MLLPIAELGILGGLSDENLVDEKLAHLFPVIFANLTHTVISLQTPRSEQSSLSVAVSKSGVSAP